MSLFKANLYWGTLVGGGEEFDEGHLQCGDGKIFVGSFAGLLRVFEPERGDFKPHHLKAEKHLGAPIMQILLGQFGAARLCVLQFKKVAFYTLDLELVKEHILERNAFNMCSGQFTQQNRDLICIQSCDGMLMIYDADQKKYQTQLSPENFVLPGPITYSKISNGFLLQNSCYEMEFYKYSDVAQQQNSDKKRPQPVWIRNLGEQAQKVIEVPRLRGFLVIAEQMLFQLDDTGAIKAQKRLDYPPSTLLVTPSDTLIVASFTHHIMIYRDLVLQWAAKTDHVCHGLLIGVFNGVEGLMVTLNEQGYLSVIYLGAEQVSVQKEVQLGNKHSYKEMEELYRKALQEIGERDNKKQTIKRTEASVNMHFRLLSVGPTKEYVEQKESLFQISGSLLQCKFEVVVTASQSLQSAKLQIYCDQSVLIEDVVFEESILEGGREYCYTVRAYSTKQIPSRRVVNIVMSWVGGSHSSDYVLPMGLFCYKVRPIKEAKYKITFSIDQLQLHELFKEIKSSENLEEGGNIMTLQLADGQVTGLLSKQMDKLRVQSDKIEAIGFLLREVVARAPNRIQFTDEIPLKDIYDVIDQHFSLRQALRDYEKEMEQKASEFKAIQKKLLGRFKENNPTTYKSLDLLLETSFEGFKVLMENAEECQQQLDRIEYKLLLVSDLLVQLISMRFNLKAQYIGDLERIFRIQNREWEEEVFININYYLNKQVPEVVHEDTQRVRKIITMLVDRFSKIQQ